MSAEMRVQSLNRLLGWMLRELEHQDSLFGIPRSLFFEPRPNAPYASEMYGHHLATPIGPAAGPHTQLTQNILCAWLSGGRFIELKTVQIMDELEIPRPCIDMEDEGYNVEWSQELKLEQSVEEYVKAWVLIHVLRRLLGLEDKVPFGTIFNMSVGYNLEGIQTPRMVQFMDRLADASEAVSQALGILRKSFPQFRDMAVPGQISNSVTLSTMHGCPPDEIERIAHHLMVDRGLHTTVKLNPTLLGQSTVMSILHDSLGFSEIDIPDKVFEHDLKYPRAVQLIRSLQQVADEQGLMFGVKLSNTLAMANHRSALPGDEMYMSGRPLYPVTMNLFHKLMQEFEGNLNVSYSAGADALNVVDILAAGARPVTVASDLLKPGGYSRMLQYLENLEEEMRYRNASSLDELARNRDTHLSRAAAEALLAPRYKKQYFAYGLPKVQSGLDLFDCVVAPCMEQCAVCQDVPEYAWLIGQGDPDAALRVILARNPLPAVTGYVCTHLCQTRCIRNDYDEPVAIRALKRYAEEYGRVDGTGDAETNRTGDACVARTPDANGHRVAIIGAGPSGLAAAYFLALHGIRCTIFESKEEIGGMMRMVPPFRLPDEVIQRDVDRINALGVDIKLSHPINEPPESLLEMGFDAVYIACGFQRSTRLDIEGIEGPGVHTAFEILEQARRGETVDLGSKALVIGGGDTAMDAARVAQRFTGRPATIVYRRSELEMPASEEEKAGAFDEDNELIELTTPIRVIRKDGGLVGLECLRNELGEPGEDGRRRPVPIAGSEFQIEADSVIVAIGQQSDLDFLKGSVVSVKRDGAIVVDPSCWLAGGDCLYAGGDVVDGPESIIAACADGRRAAEAICAQLDVEFSEPSAPRPVLSPADILLVKQQRARREPRRDETNIGSSTLECDLVEETLSEEAARSEAARCLQCSTFCDKCVEVCPNRANFSYSITPVGLQVPLLTCQGTELIVDGEEPFHVEQSRQIVHVSDFCNECGNCATFCVHQGKPYADKPRLFLNRDDFQKEQDNAFFIQGNTIWRREGGRGSRLAVQDGLVEYETQNVHLVLSGGFQIKAMNVKRLFAGTISLRSAAEMALIHDGLLRSLPFLLE